VVGRLVSKVNDGEAATMFMLHCLKMLIVLFSGGSSSAECCDEELILNAVLHVIKVQNLSIQLPMKILQKS